MLKRIIALLLWVIFLLWVYAKDRMTKEEHIQRESERLQNSPIIQEMDRRWKEEIAADPELKEAYIMETYESALYDVDMEDLDK